MARKKRLVPKPEGLSEAVSALLEMMKKAEVPHQLYGRDSGAGREVVESVFNPNLRNAAMALPKRQQYYWFLAELVRIFRTRTGESLAMNCEMVVQKWQGFGLRMDLMTWLLNEVWKRVCPEPAG